MTLDKNILTFDNFSNAKEWIDQNVQSDDVILYENDLPDLYESNLTL